MKGPAKRAGEDEDGDEIETPEHEEHEVGIVVEEVEGDDEDASMDE